MISITAIVDAGTAHASGWMIIKNIQVTMIQDVKTIKNNLILANTGFLVVFISDPPFVCGQYSDS